MNEVSMVQVANIAPDKTKEFQMELMMERLRSKTSQHKNLAETSKAVRMNMLDKRWALDSADRIILQKSLDSLQHCIKVSSLQSLIERLECLSRQLGLKFMVGSSGVDLFISSDMFYLEILLESTGAVKDVKIHHEGKIEQQSCDEIVSCISRGDFADFTSQLEGLTAIYQLNAEKKVKAKAFSALQSLEADLGTLAQLQAFIKDPWSQVHKSPIGFLQKRRGGHAMKLTYFVSPYELLDKEKGLQLLTSEMLTLGKPVSTGGLVLASAPKYNNVGLSATVMLEGSAAHKLQVTPIVSIAPRPMGKSSPIYAPLGMQNSTMLPACFTLKLPSPMPLCSELARRLAANTEATVAADWARARPMLQLVVQHAARQHSVDQDVQPNLNRGLFVSLPDQSQCYFLTERAGLEGAMVSSIPFTHPSHVPALLTCLRQQALFNTLIASCVRPDSRQDIESSLMFELSALSWQHISISLEHPLDENMATVELELGEPGAPRAAVCTLAGPPTPAAAVAAAAAALNDYITKVLQKSYSIPIMLRALVKCWESREAASKQINGGYSALDSSNFSLGQGGLDPGGEVGVKPEPGGAGGGRAMFPSSVNHPHQGGNYLTDMQQNLSMLTSEDPTPAVQSEHKPEPKLHPTLEDKKSKKRRQEDTAWVPRKKNKSIRNKAVMLESSSDGETTSDDSESYVEERDLNSEWSGDEAERTVSPTSPTDLVSDLELSGLDPAELIGGGSSTDNRTSSDWENSGDGDAARDAQDMGEIMRNSQSFHKPEHKKQKHKPKDTSESRSGKPSSASILLELSEPKPIPTTPVLPYHGSMSASVSITPIHTTPTTIPATPANNPPPNFSSVLCLERRPGIEIIPISTAPPASLPSSITITPITPSQAKSMEERHKSEKKSSSSKSSDERSREKEKKKKKKREDSMGPPDKLPSKHDPLTKPVSVSIKPTDVGSLSVRAVSPNSLVRKFSPSPTHGRSVSITKSSSPSGSKSKSGSTSHHNSPRHSPVQNSPKHNLSGYSSPKNHSTSSPKHGSSGSSGKPSMSALKSATGGSPSSKSSSSYDLSKLPKASGSKDYSSSSGPREKDRKSQASISFSSNSGANSPKIKSSMVKLKQLEITALTSADMQTSDCLISPPNLEISKTSTPSQVRNRKGSLSAVIDKLKSAQHCSEGDTVTVTKTSSSSSGNLSKERTNSTKSNETKASSSSSSKISDNKNQEYMVKPSSDGMKITINKTRSKESSSNTNTSGSKSNFSTNSSTSVPKQSTPVPQSNTSVVSSTGSPKTHTGLKPGVISGPASKKTQAMQSSKSSTTVTNVSSNSNSPINKTSSSSGSSSSGNGSKVPHAKSSSGSSMSVVNMTKSISKTSSGSPKSSSTDVSKQSRDRDRDKSRPSKGSSGTSSNSDKFFSSNKSERRLSPANPRDEVDGDRNFKSASIKESNFLVEGLIKSLDTSKFQIPKLSARNIDESSTKSQTIEKSILQNDRIALNENSKMLDFMSRNMDHTGKFSFQHLNQKLPDGTKTNTAALSMLMPKAVVNLGPSAKVPTVQMTKMDIYDQPTNLSFTSSLIKHSDLKASTKNDKASDLSKSQLKDENINIDFSSSKQYPSISVCTAETVNQNYVKQMEAVKSFIVPQGKDDIRKPFDISMKPPLTTSTLKSGSTTPQEAAEILLDFSSASGSKGFQEHKNKLTSVVDRAMTNVPVRRNTPPLGPPGFPTSPSVSVHIVKSPVPSPLVIPSPHSNSPCITDDELMDEALVGPGK